MIITSFPPIVQICHYTTVVQVQNWVWMHINQAFVYKRGIFTVLQLLTLHMSFLHMCSLCWSVHTSAFTNSLHSPAAIWFSASVNFPCCSPSQLWLETPALEPFPICSWLLHNQPLQLPSEHSPTRKRADEQSVTLSKWCNTKNMTRYAICVGELIASKYAAESINN